LNAGNDQKPPECNCSDVLQVCSMRTFSYTSVCWKAESSADGVQLDSYKKESHRQGLYSFDQFTTLDLC
ncbi:MAG: hypothetical protein KJ950_14715, partial [Proteobacteria bacterium]|nr:hypothetical protein [Pseudomonadota bacterium]MBU1689021.1 hypothetical protein [Pseudomonadota bacterium]